MVKQDDDEQKVFVRLLFPPSSISLLEQRCRGNNDRYHNSNTLTSLSFERRKERKIVHIKIKVVYGRGREESL